MAPRPALKSRRVREMVMSCPPCFGRCPQHGSDDAIVRAAAAEIAVEALAHLLLARPRIGIEQCLRAHDHAVGAVAALRRLLADEGALERVRFVDRAQPLDGGDTGIAERPDLGDAGADWPPVGQHRAGAALGKAAAELGAVELEIVAQNIEQRRVRLGRHRPAHAVDVQADGHGRLPNDAAVRSAVLRQSTTAGVRPAKLKADRSLRESQAPIPDYAALHPGYSHYYYSHYAATAPEYRRAPSPPSSRCGTLRTGLPRWRRARRSSTPGNRRG